MKLLSGIFLSLMLSSCFCPKKKEAPMQSDKYERMIEIAIGRDLRLGGNRS